MTASRFSIRSGILQPIHIDEPAVMRCARGDENLTTPLALGKYLSMRRTAASRPCNVQYCMHADQSAYDHWHIHLCLCSSRHCGSLGLEGGKPGLASRTIRSRGSTGRAIW